MIFAAWALTWTFSATSVLMLLVPATALLVRGSYLERRVRFRPSYVILGLVVFALHLTSFPVQIAAARGVGSVLGVLMIAHFVAGLMSAPLRTGHLQYHIAHYFHAAARSARLTKERYAGLEYARRVAVYDRHSAAARFAGWWRLSFGVALAAVTEFVVLVNDMSDVVATRGVLPHPKEWQERVTNSQSHVLGDSLLLPLVIVVSRVGSVILVPPLLMRLAGFVPGL